jgi:hypothetical protein
MACRIEKESKEFKDYVELKRTNGSTTILPIVWRILPRNGGRSLSLLCPYCNTPRRLVYGGEWDRFSGRSKVVVSAGWRCRSCARLRYSFEGGYADHAYNTRRGVRIGKSCSRAQERRALARA